MKNYVSFLPYIFSLTFPVTRFALYICIKYSPPINSAQGAHRQRTESENFLNEESSSPILMWLFRLESFMHSPNCVALPFHIHSYHPYHPVPITHKVNYLKSSSHPYGPSRISIIFSGLEIDIIYLHVPVLLDIQIFAMGNCAKSFEPGVYTRSKRVQSFPLVFYL